MLRVLRVLTVQGSAARLSWTREIKGHAETLLISHASKNELLYFKTLMISNMGSYTLKIFVFGEYLCSLSM